MEDFGLKRTIREDERKLSEQKPGNGPSELETGPAEQLQAAGRERQTDGDGEDLAGGLRKVLTSEPPGDWEQKQPLAGWRSPAPPTQALPPGAALIASL